MESKTLIYILGYAENPQDKKFAAEKPEGLLTRETWVLNKEKAYAMIDKYNTPEKVAAGLEELKTTWNNLLSIFKVRRRRRRCRSRPKVRCPKRL